MSKLSEKQLLLVTVGTAVLLTGGLGFLIWNDLKTIDKEQKTTQGLNQKITSAQREIDKIPDREYRVIANREISPKEVAYLPEESEIENFWGVLERFAAESGVKISKIGDSGSHHRVKSKGPIERVEQLLALRGTSEEFLHFLNLIENYDRIINVTEFSITPGKPDLDGKVRHNIRLALATFSYPKKIANTIVSIPGYDKKKESPEVKKYLSRIKIEEKETYTRRTAIGRRDPFDDVRHKVQPNAENGKTGPNEAQQEAMLQQLVENIRTLQEGLKIEDHLRKIGDLYRLSQQLKENRELFRQIGSMMDGVRKDGSIRVRRLQERFHTEVEVPYQAVKQQIGVLEQYKPALSVRQVKEILDRVAKDFDDQKWKKLDDEILSFNDLSNNGDKVVEEAREMAAKIADFKHRADVIRKFEKRKIEVSSIVYSPNGMSVALINGKQYAVNDALDADGQVIVADIGENYVIFQTQGVEIKKTLTNEWR